MVAIADRISFLPRVHSSDACRKLISPVVVAKITLHRLQSRVRAMNPRAAGHSGTRSRGLPCGAAPPTRRQIRVRARGRVRGRRQKSRELGRSE